MTRTFAGRYRAVMAVLADVGGLRMIKGNHKRVPARSRRVARIALIGSRRMAATLTGGGVAIMAAAALIRGLTMVKRRNHRHPYRGGMTGVALIAGQRMSTGFECAWAHTIVTPDAGTGLPCYSGMIEGAD